MATGRNRARSLSRTGGQHLRIERDSGGPRARLSDAPPVSGHRPSVDVMFQTAAEALGPGVIGVLLTGMGKDGAAVAGPASGGARTLCKTKGVRRLRHAPRRYRTRGRRDHPALTDLAGAILDPSSRDIPSAACCAPDLKETPMPKPCTN